MVAVLAEAVVVTSPRRVRTLAASPVPGCGPAMLTAPPLSVSAARAPLLRAPAKAASGWSLPSSPWILLSWASPISVSLNGVPMMFWIVERPPANTRVTEPPPPVGCAMGELSWRLNVSAARTCEKSIVCDCQFWRSHSS